MPNSEPARVSLERCPFCGGDQIVVTSGFAEFEDKTGWSAICKTCFAEVERDTEAAAIATWNTRTPPTSPGWQDIALNAAEIIVRDVAELPDRSSPADWPEAMLVTPLELHLIVTRALEAQSPAAPECGR